MELKYANSSLNREFNFNHTFPYNNGYVSGMSILPPQAIPSKQKDEEWLKNCADALEREGLRQLQIKSDKYKGIYQMVDGKLSFFELSEVLPHLKNLDVALSDVDIPPFIKHYDLVGIIVNAFLGWYSDFNDGYYVTEIDSQATNEYLRDKSNLLVTWIQEVWNNELNKRLAQRGIDVNKTDFGSPEEQAQYQQMIQQEKSAMAPPEIESYLKQNWRSQAAIWGQNTLDADYLRHNMGDIDQENFKNYLLTGSEFYEIEVGYDYYKPKSLHPLIVFSSQESRIKPVQEGEYAGKIEYLTASDIIAEHGAYLTAKEKRQLLGSTKKTGGAYGGSGGTYRLSAHNVVSNMYKERLVPFEGYDDYMNIVSAEDLTGIPMGIKTTIDAEGKETKKPAYMARPLRSPGYYYDTAVLKTDNDIEVRSDLFRVTTSYFISYKKIYTLTFETETGLVVQETVSDELLNDFLKENGIKKENLTRSEYEKDAPINTYIEDWVQECYKVVKINGANLVSSPIYIGGPMEYQIPGDSNMYQVQLPICGFTGPAMIDRIIPWQMMYNVSNNQAWNLMEKEIGMLFLMDIGFIPSEFAKYGPDTPAALDKLMEIAKNTGLLPIDTSKSNIQERGQISFNQFQSVNLSFSEQLATRIQLANYARQNALSAIGLNEQALGSMIKYGTAEGVRQGVHASYVQTQVYFDTFNKHRRKFLGTYLSVAQYCQKNGKDSLLSYSTDDLSRGFLTFSDDGVDLRALRIYPSNDAVDRRKLEEFRQALLQMNFAGDDILAIGELFMAKSVSQLIDALNTSMARKSDQAERQHQQQMEIIQQQSENEERIDLREYGQELEIEDRRNAAKIEVARLNALGRAADKQADQTSFDTISEEADRSLKQNKLDADIDYRDRSLNAQQKNNEERNRLEWEKLRLKSLEIRNKQMQNRTQRFVSSLAHSGSGSK